MTGPIETQTSLGASSRRWRVIQGLAGIGLIGWLVSCAASPPDDTLHADSIVDLKGTWQLHAGELAGSPQDIFSTDFDASSWSEAPVPGPFMRSEREMPEQSGWFRKVVVLEGERTVDSAPLGLALGRINSAYVVWIDGRRLGSVGRLPASAGGPANGRGQGQVDYDRRVVWPVPPSAAADGRLVIALHVWTDPALGALGGPHEGDFRLGPLRRLAREQATRELPETILVTLFTALGLFHLALYFRRRDQVGYFWFSVVSLLVAAYSFLRTQWKYHLLAGLSFGLLKETEHIVLFLLLPSFVQLIWTLLGIEFKPFTRWGQIASLSMAVVIVVVPGFAINQILIRFWEVLVLASIAHGAVVIARERRQAEALTISIGIFVGSVAFVHDILVDFAVLDTPRITILGFAAFVVSLSATLGVQFARRMKEAEESRRRETELRANEEVARRSDQAKSEFLANMSHEIRTPMTAILGGVDLLIRKKPEPETTRRLKVIQQSAAGLLRLIDEILDFAKIEAGRLELRPGEFDLHQAVDGVVALFSTQAERTGVSLHCQGLDQVPRNVVSDGDRWRQVLLNLLSNALKFTAPGGEVTIQLETTVGSAERDDDRWIRVVTTVRDTGIGIEPEVLPTLFEPFTQADASTSRQHGGSGLGLAISRRLVGLLDGEISIQSKVGRGTDVRFEVPMVEAEPTAEIQAAAHPDEAPQAGPAAWLGKRLLLVEDNEVNELIVGEQLRQAGFDVLTARDGVEALEALERETIDLVLMDCQMPRMDGYEATRRWRRNEPEGQHLPIIALTAHALDGERERCLSAGMDDYITKPFHSEHLVKVIGRRLRPAVGGSVVDR